MADVTRLHKLVRKANGLQDFQRAGLNGSGTSVMGRPVVLIDNLAGNAMPIQLGRHEQAHWTCAHHQYLGVSGHQVSSRQARAAPRIWSADSMKLDLEDGAPVCGLFPRSEEGTPYDLTPSRVSGGWHPPWPAKGIKGIQLLVGGHAGLAMV